MIAPGFYDSPLCHVEDRSKYALRFAPTFPVNRGVQAQILRQQVWFVGVLLQAGKGVVVAVRMTITSTTISSDLG